MTRQKAWLLAKYNLNHCDKVHPMVRSPFARQLATFTHTFNTICSNTSGIRAQPIYGIAVSGGVDSMALAFLCSKMRDKATKIQHNPQDDLLVPRFRAFIVDHRAREGSGEEAKIVRTRLRSLGKSVILQYSRKTS